MNDKKSKSPWWGLALGAAAVLSLVPVAANAADARIHAAVCDGSNVSVGTYVMGATFGGTGTAICPIPSNTALHHQTVDTLNLHGYNAGSVGARACASNWSTYQIACGVTKSPASGNYALSFFGNDLVHWGSSKAHWFPYVAVNLSFASRLHGLYIAQ
ncbi:MAG: hypothetical protein RIT81_23810 [Deltaproteobacteria bacterium]